MKIRTDLSEINHLNPLDKMDGHLPKKSIIAVKQLW